MKISQQPLPYRSLLLALVATMVVLGEAEVCSEVVGVGDCEPNCYSACIQRHPNGKATYEQNTCKCFFECPNMKKCNMGLGRCSQFCNQECCADKCASTRAGGVGYCDDNLGIQFSLCQCQYPC